MKRYSKDKDINQTVRVLIKFGWKVRAGKKHAAAISPGGNRLTIPSTPSDYRAWRNFTQDVKNISEREGVNYAY